MKRVFPLFLFFLFLFNNLCHAIEIDSIIVEGKFASKFVSKILLCSYDKEIPLLENNVGITKTFRFALSSNISPGVYYLEYIDGIKHKVDFIIDGIENKIKLELRYGNYYNYPLIIESTQNKKWYDFLSDNQPIINHINENFNYFIIHNYQIKKSRFLKDLNKEINIYTNNWKSFVRENANTLAGILVLNEPYHFSDLGDNTIPRDLFRRDLYWEGIDTNNPLLINSYLYRKHIDNYLLYLFDNKKRLIQLEHQKELKKCISVILNNFANNELTNKFAIDYLLNHKLISGNEELISFIINYNYTNDK